MKILGKTQHKVSLIFVVLLQDGLLDGLIRKSFIGQTEVFLSYRPFETQPHDTKATQTLKVHNIFYKTAIFVQT